MAYTYRTWFQCTSLNIIFQADHKCCSFIFGLEGHFPYTFVFLFVNFLLSLTGAGIRSTILKTAPSLGGIPAMKKRSKLFALFLLLFPLLLSAQSREDFSALVDFSLDLEGLSRLAIAGEGEFPEDAPLVILTGSVASREVLQPGPEDYLGEIELLGGRWQGVEEVTTFRCIVQFRGAEYATFIPARRSRQTPPEEIPLNASLLVVGKLSGVRADDRGNVVIVQGYFVRFLD